MMEAVNAVPALLSDHEDSPFEAARTRRSLSREEAATLAALSLEEVAWLEEGRLYRFASPHDALAAGVAYGSALGIDHREALELAGRPAPPRDAGRTLTRLVGGIAVTLVLALLAAAVVVPRLVHNDEHDPLAGASLPAPWRISVDVLNGAGDVNHTRRVADRIGSLAYRVGRVRPADRFDYPETAVYYPSDRQLLAERLARELCAPTKPLPAGNSKLRLVVIVGPERVGGC